MSGAIRSQCSLCGATFVSVTAFDSHRVGLYVPGGRRCLTISEMQIEGMILDEQGRWFFDPEQPRPSQAALTARYGKMEQEHERQASA